MLRWMSTQALYHLYHVDSTGRFCACHSHFQPWTRRVQWLLPGIRTRGLQMSPFLNVSSKDWKRCRWFQLHGQRNVLDFGSKTCFYDELPQDLWMSDTHLVCQCQFQPKTLFLLTLATPQQACAVFFCHGCPGDAGWSSPAGARRHAFALRFAMICKLFANALQLVSS